MNLTGKDRVLAKVALDDGLLSRKDLRRAVEIQVGEKGEGGAPAELSTILEKHGFLDAEAVKKLLVRTKERYFHKLYLKVKAQELGVDVRQLEEKEPSSGENALDDPEPPPPPTPGHDHNRSRHGSTTAKRRRGLRGRARAPRWVFPAVLAAAAIAAIVVLAFVVHGSGTVADPDLADARGSSEEGKGPSGKKPPSGDGTAPEQGGDRDGVSPGTPGGLFGRTEFEREVEKPSELEKVDPPPRPRSMRMDPTIEREIEAIDRAFNAGDWSKLQSLCRDFEKNHAGHELSAYFRQLAQILESPEGRKHLDDLRQRGLFEEDD